MAKYVICSFSLRALQQDQKMRIKRILYGYKTSKVVKGKAYQSQNKGLVEQFRGLVLGKGAFMIPKEKESIIRDIFHQHKVHYQLIEVSRDS